MKGPTQPARQSDRVSGKFAEETIEFAHRRDKRRKANKLAKQMKRKQRK